MCSVKAGSPVRLFIDSVFRTSRFCESGCKTPNPSTSKTLKRSTRLGSTYLTRTCQLSTPLSSVSIVDSCHLSHKILGFWDLNNPSTVIHYFGLPGIGSSRFSIPERYLLCFLKPKVPKSQNSHQVRS
jgi:hypothetical protein